MAAIRAKLAAPDAGKGANADDVAALVAFYGARTDGPLWITEMGFSAKGQAALFEIEKADDWGLDKTAFVLPAADVLPATAEAQADAEIKLDLAILKYARFARGGRWTPLAISKLFDQAPAAPRSGDRVDRDRCCRCARRLSPRAAAEARAVREAARGAHQGAWRHERQSRRHERNIRRILMNMERWRWMPEDLGSVYVWNNSPAFMLYVVKDGKTIYADKTLVGTLNYATPVFTSDMATIVFNPDWNAPRDGGDREFAAASSRRKLLDPPNAQTLGEL